MAEEFDIPMPSMMPAGAAWRNVRRREGLDGATRRLALFAGVIGGGLLLLVGAWSLTGPRSTAVPIVEADSRPLRTKPENRGGLQLAGQDDAIMSGSSGGQDAMAPPPEAPAPMTLSEAAIVPASPALRASPEPAPPPSVPVPSQAETAGPPARDIATPAIPRAAGAQVQLAALATEQAARAEWQRLMRRVPELLGGREPVVSRLERADGKVFWRLRTGGFPDIAQATAFCATVRAKGISCGLGAR